MLMYKYIHKHDGEHPVRALHNVHTEPNFEVLRQRYKHLIYTHLKKGQLHKLGDFRNLNAVQRHTHQVSFLLHKKRRS